MGFHTFDVDRAENLDDEGRYRYCSREELLSLLRPNPDAVVADFGSGTGFYTDDVAPHVGTCYAVDVQSEMHEFYRQKGAPDTVTFVTADVSSLPFADDELDAAFSTMTYHEFASDDAVAELARVVKPGGRVVTVDWTKAGDGESGPPTDERYGLGDAVTAFEAHGFDVIRATTRRETFVCVARNR
ncbi:methylase involved in ubiquinone/menaquinone biosynthesis [Halogeometricum borinquense DSM 11551]|uniref:Methylase involved in ubiquinone/menaquinone biosynthesis n=2 Tax=Halogeometricum borinquense TaxID=60847 RepID=E4NLR1_HALBP|nr:class I SAM-dependent methyltransferase [Halogeometricum borinquense]ADQ67264.1 methylase involved in ubiquinone/menaquinone biosynthesis [Halogeometricum borinquense DSM 11551]ELY28480.1 methylase involved in ubiquinone/menaquinone biosynthesis [Halogeometricum borinquense DSM 11551]RYJ13715.1 class I SAM-dependent methyltransferase [Halogeometricum borinquense]